MHFMVHDKNRFFIYICINTDPVMVQQVLSGYIAKVLLLDKHYYQGYVHYYSLLCFTFD